MKQFLRGATQGGHTVIFVQWDTKARTLSLNVYDPTGARLDYTNLDIVHGILDTGEIHWYGQKFAITKFHHQELQSRFPSLCVEEQYAMADEWCMNKNKTIKNPYQFMTNWLKKARGGNVSAGNVVY